MADDVRAGPADQTPAESKSSFGDMLERLVKTIVRNKEDPPVVKKSVVEFVTSSVAA